MTAPPTVSVVVAVHDEEAHVAECLTSLLSQDHPAEIIVVDDGSRDRTAAIAAGFDGVTLLRQDHLGAAAARNRGAAAASGDVLVFVDGDMRFPPGWVGAMVAPLADPEVDGTFTADIHVANGHRRWARAHMLGRGLPAHTHFRDRPDTFEIHRAVRTDRFREVGGFDEIGHGEDVTIGRKLGRPAVRADGADCYHHEPEDLADIFRSARWLGSGERITETPGAWRAHLPWRAARTGWGLARRHRSPDLVLYRLVWSSGLLVGWFGRRWTAK
jgi:glycosyltransferase involved in cell wall biosynthesis